MVVGAVPADAQLPGAVVGLCRVLERFMPGLTVHAPEVDDVAVIKAFPLLGMINELLDRHVVAFQRRGQEGVRMTIEVVRQPAAPQLARQARGERQEVVFGRDLVQGSQSPSVYRVDVAAVAGEPEDFSRGVPSHRWAAWSGEHTALGVGRMELRQRHPQLFGEDLLLVPVEPAVAVASPVRRAVARAG